MPSGLGDAGYSGIAVSSFDHCLAGSFAEFFCITVSCGAWKQITHGICYSISLELGFSNRACVIPLAPFS
jgi:hypothetical protein